MNRIQRLFFRYGALSIALCVVSLSTAFASPFLAVNNARAGQDVPFRASNLHSNEIVDILLTRPQNAPIAFQAQADIDGILTHTIHSLHTKKSGEYTLTIQRSIAPQVQKTITVFPGTVSSYTSQIQLSHHTASANNQESIDVEIQLRDAFENPIPQESVRIISSRNEDRITLHTPRTDHNGKISASIQSEKAGSSTLSVLAQGNVLFQKPNIVFYVNTPNTLSFSGSSGNPRYADFLRAQIFGDSEISQASYLTIESIPAEAQLNETITFTVTARDINGEIVPTYQGTVRFNTPNDSRSVLPSQYTFTKDDQGQHTFFLAASFGTTGQQTFEVHDLDDFRIAGEANLNITRGSSIPERPSNPALQITAPLPGKYQTNRVTITGTAQDVESVRIVDGMYELVTNLEVDDNGNFVFQTPRLGDGVHIFQVFDMYSDLSSETVEIEIDSSPPNTITVSTEPELPFSPGQEFQVIVSSNESLASASAIYQDVLTQLIPSNTDYVRTLTAPLTPGEYPVHVLASDMLGNEIRKDNALVIIIQAEEEKNEPEDLQPTAPKEPLGGVRNVQAQRGDGRITLLWSPPQSGEATQYKIEFAQTPLFTEPSTEEGDIGIFDELFSSPSQNQDDPFLPLLEDEESQINEKSMLNFDQFNITPDNRVQWYVDNLEDNKKYYFRVRAIDKDGIEGPASDIIEEITNGAAQSLIPQETPVTGNGGTVIALIVGIILFGGLLLYRRRSQI